MWDAGACLCEALKQCMHAQKQTHCSTASMSGGTEVIEATIKVQASLLTALTPLAGFLRTFSYLQTCLHSVKAT